MKNINAATQELLEVPAQSIIINTTVPVELSRRHSTQRGDAADATSPQLSYERDRSVGMTDGKPSAMVQQAGAHAERSELAGRRSNPH